MSSDRENQEQEHPELTPALLEELRQILLNKQREMIARRDSAQQNALHEFERLGEVSNIPHHAADLGSETSDQNFQMIYAEFESSRLAEIERALEKMTNGDYGICEGTEEPIPVARLKVMPECRFSVEYQKQLEREGKTGQEVKAENQKRSTLYQDSTHQDFPRFRN